LGIPGDGSLEDAASKSSVGEMVYVNGVERFDAPDFYPGRGGVREINESGSIVFTIDRNYDPSDQYFKRGQFGFVMTASISNFTRLHGGMGATSHDAIMFRGSGAGGYRLECLDTSFAIAIWLVRPNRMLFGWLRAVPTIQLRNCRHTLFK
jgi:hypothetical protein